MNIPAAAFAVALSLTAGACATSAPTVYANNADVSVALRKLPPGTRAMIASFDDQSAFDEGCRLFGPIRGSGNRTVPVFLRDAFDDEFKFAGIHGDKARITLTLQAARFSSVTGVTNGSWAFAVQLSRNGQSFVITDQYDFPSGFDAQTACVQTAQALPHAVQRIVLKAVADPRFAAMVR